MLNETIVHRADPIGQESDPPDWAVLRILPRIGRIHPDSLAKVMDRDAEAIADVLQTTLPQGTWDRVVAKIVNRHASMLVAQCPDHGPRFWYSKEGGNDAV